MYIILIAILLSHMSVMFDFFRLQIFAVLLLCYVSRRYHLSVDSDFQAITFVVVDRTF